MLVSAYAEILSLSIFLLPNKYRSEHAKYEGEQYHGAKDFYDEFLSVAEHEKWFLRFIGI